MRREGLGGIVPRGPGRHHTQLFPQKYHGAIPCMPVTNVSQTEHIPKDPNPWELQDVFCGIHELIDRKVWSKDPAALAEAKKEAQGLIEAGTMTTSFPVLNLKLKLEHQVRKLPLDNL